MYHQMKNQMDLMGTTDEFAYCFKKRDREESGFLSDKMIRDALEEFMNMKRRPNEQKNEISSENLRDILMTLNRSKQNSKYPYRDLFVHLYGPDIGDALYLKDLSDFDMKKPKENE